MKSLLLLRHAKSSWEDSSLADFDRPLAPRGEKAARRMGRELAARGWLPDLALVSPAARAEQTWALASAGLPRKVAAKFPEGLYEASADEILAVIRKAPETADTLLVVGHNPGLEELARQLVSEESDSQALTQVRTKFPTAATARLVFGGAWHEIQPGSAQLTHFLRPRELD